MPPGNRTPKGSRDPSTHRESASSRDQSVEADLARVRQKVRDEAQQQVLLDTVQIELERLATIYSSQLQGTSEDFDKNVQSSEATKPQIQEAMQDLKKDLDDFRKNLRSGNILSQQACDKIQDAKKSNRVLRNRFDRLVKNAQDLIETVHTTKTEQSKQALEEKKKEIDACFNKIADNCEELLFTFSETSTEYEERSNELQALSDMHDQVTSMILRAFIPEPRKSDDPASQGGDSCNSSNGNSSNGRSRPAKALEPPVLTKDMYPEEVRVWMEQIEAYFSVSKFHLEEIKILWFFRKEPLLPFARLV